MADFGDQTTWTYAAGTTWTGDQTVTVTLAGATDSLLNAIAASPTNDSFTVDNTGPTSSASYTAAAVNDGDAQTVTILFSEAVTGLPTITLTGSSSGPLATNAPMADFGDQIATQDRPPPGYVEKAHQ